MHASVAASWDARTTDVEGNWYASRISLFMTTMSSDAIIYLRAPTSFGEPERRFC